MFFGACSSSSFKRIQAVLCFTLFLGIFPAAVADDTGCQTSSLLQFSAANSKVEASQGRFAIYRLIGNDMPPLQSRGQLRWNTKYTLDYEPEFEGVTKRWVLNRIWNETEYTLIKNELLEAGVKPEDIVSICFDFNKFRAQESSDDKLVYMTSINEGRDFAIRHGQQSFEWTLMLDGNTFITQDSWATIQTALTDASRQGKLYMKIPYHRLQFEQNPSWLHQGTTMHQVLKYAPVKGESQIAVHRSATVLFDTNRTYGDANKLYALHTGGFCDRNSESKCHCASVPETLESKEFSGKKYSETCGLVVRLWSYSTSEALMTDLPDDKREGFFCFWEETYPRVKDLQNGSPARSKGELYYLLKHGVEKWSAMTPDETRRYQLYSTECQSRCTKFIIIDPSLRTAARITAKAVALDGASKVIGDGSFCSSN
jgi:hypothetical protein